MRPDVVGLSLFLHLDNRKGHCKTSPLMLDDPSIAETMQNIDGFLGSQHSEDLTRVSRRAAKSIKAHDFGSFVVGSSNLGFDM